MKNFNGYSIFIKFVILILFITALACGGGGSETVRVETVVVVATSAESESQPPQQEEQPTPTVPPTPDTQLFWDDFESGIRPEWKISREGFAAVNGNLRQDEDGLFASGVIEDSNWQNYQLRLYEYGLGKKTELKIRVRVQDADNFMSLSCNRKKYNAGTVCAWYKVINGEWKKIPGTQFEQFGEKQLFQIEIQNNVYRVHTNGSNTVRFTDETFENGGFALQNKGYFKLGGIEIFPLP